MKELVEEEEALKSYKGSIPPVPVLESAKKNGFSDKYLSQLLDVAEEEIRNARHSEKL